MVGVLAVVLAACAESDPPAATGTVATTTTTTAPPVTTEAPAPSTTVEDPRVEQLASCVEHAKFQAFTGNEFWASMWQEAGETDDGMRDVCTFLADGNDAWLAQIHQNWQVLQGIEESAPTTDAPVLAPDAALVQGCLDWVTWFVAAGEPDVVVAWGELAESPTRLRAACTELAGAMPERAEEMRDEVDDIVRFLNEPSPTQP